jgi:hypothetical protein
MKHPNQPELWRLSRELCIAFGDDPDREGNERITAYDEVVVAFMLAIIEPSPRMIQAAIDRDSIGEESVYHGVWRAMIDAALAEE